MNLLTSYATDRNGEDPSNHICIPLRDFNRRQFCTTMRNLDQLLASTEALEQRSRSTMKKANVIGCFTDPEPLLAQALSALPHKWPY